MTKKQICFYMFKRNEKDFLLLFFFKEENFTHNMNLCNHELNKTSTNTIMNYLFLYFKKSACIKNHICI